MLQLCCNGVKGVIMDNERGCKRGKLSQNNLLKRLETRKRLLRMFSPCGLVRGCVEHWSCAPLADLIRFVVCGFKDEFNFISFEMKI